MKLRSIPRSFANFDREFAVIAVVVLSVALGWVLMFYQNEAITQAAITSYQQTQLEIVRAAARSADDYVRDRMMHDPAVDMNVVEQALFKRFIEPIHLLNNGDAWIYAPDHVVYDQSADFPDEYRGKSMAEIFAIQSKYGADHYAEMVKAVSAAREDTGWYVWLPEKGPEIAAWSPVRVGSHVWSLGMSTPLSEILESVGFPAHQRMIAIVMSSATLLSAMLLMGLVRAMSLRRRADRSLRESEARSRALLKAIPDYMFRLSGDGRVLDARISAEWADLHPGDLLVGKSVGDFVPADMIEGASAMISSALETRKIELLELKLPSQRGGTRTFEGRCVASGPDEVTIIVRDISDRKQAEEELRSSEEKYRALVDNSSDIVMRFDRSLQCLFANPAALQLFGGVSPAQNEQRAQELGCPTELMDGWKTQVSQVFETGEMREIQLDLNGPRGRMTYDWRFIPEFDQNGVVASVIGTGRDVTERILLHQQLLQSQKMEAVGQLAGGVAHDFNNLLTGILGYANLLTTDLPQNSSSYHAAKTIERAAERASDLTKQLLGFARRGKYLNEPVDLHSIVHEVIGLLSRTIDKRIGVTQRLRAERSLVMGDPSQIQQAVLNLAVNARDAMPEGGELIFETEVVDLDREYCDAHLDALPGRYLMIAVSDTGSGIPKSIQNRIFEPFFTTKEQGKGTGMGLAMVYGIVKNHGGSIHVYSEDGRGSIFRVYLPQAGEESQLPPVALSPEPENGEGVVLLVDDEEVVRTVGATILERLGYRVMLATGGREAVEIFTRRKSEIDLVLIDMIMPEMNGRDCFKAIRNIDPNARIIISSGYSMDGGAQELKVERCDGFVQKPYRIKDLAEAVSNVLRVQNSAG